MKKLISILLMLMMLLCGVAMAEDATVTAEPTPEVTAEATEEPAAEVTAEPAEPTTVEAADTEAAADTIDWSEVSLLNKGLIVTAGGLAGTFLVLILFFLTIKLMQKVLPTSDASGSTKTRA